MSRNGFGPKSLSLSNTNWGLLAKCVEIEPWISTIPDSSLCYLYSRD